MNDILFTPLRLNELESLIQNSVRKALKESRILEENNQKYIHLNTACERYNLTRQTFYNLNSKGVIKLKKLDSKGKVYVSIDEIELAMTDLK